MPNNTVCTEQYIEKMYVAVQHVLKHEDGTELIFETKKMELSIQEDWTHPSDASRAEDK